MTNNQSLMDKKLPCWLTKKQLYVAEQLIAQGFYYCADADDFYEPIFSESVTDGWSLSFPAGECFLDATCDNAIFSKNLEGREFHFQAELKAARKIIRKASQDWHLTGLNHCQLSFL
ncbi:hypothetical protein ACSQ6I_03735 [Anabaena sp. WFMT]|uniref:hypothetical protein n=1 Tax=Anabaena sp. WFMT TaxID=3449730 RepID=UPI003F239330